MSKKAYINTAIEIGDLLYGLAVKNGQYTHWKVFDRIEKAVSVSGDSIYAGNSGIGLFFLELYKHTHRKKYLDMARKAIRTASSREIAQKQSNPSFICGRLGVAYVLARLYEVTSVSLYRNRALALVKSCRGLYGSRYEYISGDAGTLLAVLHIHAMLKEQWLLDMADEYVAHILRGMRRDLGGVYWDRSPLQIRPLCGFSHGVSGIGFVFLELGRYVKNPAFYDVAKRAFTYENIHFDKTANNWLDLRADMWNSQQIADMEAAYGKGDAAALTKPRLMTAWCHGAPGIGLSRIAAFKLTGDQTYELDSNRAISTTRSILPHDISLCHGLAGNLDTFIESYLAFDRVQDWEYAQDFGKQLLQRWQDLNIALQNDKKFQERLDPTLLMGIAGVGYALLRLHNPQKTASILAPLLPAVLRAKPSKQLASLRITKADMKALLSDDSASETADVQRLKRQMTTDHPSDALVYIKQRVGKKVAQQVLLLNDDRLKEQVLQIDPDCRLYASDKSAYLFRQTPDGVEQKVISQFCYVMLAAFKKPRKVSDAIEVVRKYHNLNKQQHEILQAKALEQVRHAVAGQILKSRNNAATAFVHPRIS